MYKEKHGLLQINMHTDDEIVSGGSERSLSKVRNNQTSSDEQLERSSLQHQEVARYISERSITLVRDQLDMLPLKPERTLVITIAASVTTIADEQLSQAVTLGSALARHGLDVIDLTITPEDVALSSARLLQAAEERASARSWWVPTMRAVLQVTRNAG